MARAAVLPPSPVKRGARAAPRTTLTKSKTSTDTKKRGPAKPTQPAYRAAQQDMESDDTDDELGMMMKAPEDKPARPRGRTPGRPATKATTTRGRKTASASAPAESHDEDETSAAEAPKKRAGRPRKTPQSEPAVAPAETASRPRGRPKTGTAGKTPAGTRKTTRAAASAAAETDSAEPKQIMIATNSTTMRSNILRGPAKKKTVTFQDVLDSDSDAVEEAPAPTTGRRRATGKSAGPGKVGLGATPVRKPAATGTRGRKPAAKKETVKPLSPKKTKQLAKSLSTYASSDGEEDELSTVKDDINSPVKLVIHSPTKNGTEPTGLSSPVRKINFTPRKASSLVDENGEPKLPTPKHGSAGTGLSSPVRRINFTPNRSQNTVSENGNLALPPGKSIDFSDSVFMSSPARRPEPSPFKFSLRDTPNRGLFQNEAKPIPAPDFTPGKSSPLKMSPKKGHLGASFLESPTKASTPSFPARTSLFQSPAKRVASPFKGSLFSSKGSVGEAPAPARHDTINMAPASATKKRTSLLQTIESDQPAPDEDLEMVEEVARDIFGIELQSDSPKSTESPLSKEGPEVEAVPEGLQPQMSEDVEANPEVIGHMVEEKYRDVDEKLEQLQEEIQREPEDFGTVCFNTMEELQEPFKNLHEGTFVNDAPSDDDALVEESEPDEDGVDSEGAMEITEAARSPSTPIPEEQEIDALDASHTGPSTSSSEPPLELAALEEAQSPTPMPAIHQEYDDLEDESQDDLEEGLVSVRRPDEEQEFDSEEDAIEDDEPTIAASEATFTCMSRPRSPYELYEQEDTTSPLETLDNVPPPAPTPPAEETTQFSVHQPESAQYHDRLFDINTEMRWDAEVDALDITQSEIPTPLAPSFSNTPNAQGRRKSSFNVDLGFTPLAQQFGRWEANTPSQDRQLRPRRRGVFSLVGPLERPAETHIPDSGDVSYPDLSGNASLPNTPSLFAELPLPPQSDDSCGTPRSLLAAESPVDTCDDDMIDSPSKSEIFEDPEPALPELQQSQEGLHSEVDEDLDQDSSSEDDKENHAAPSIIPMTPVKLRADPMRTVHTVSKVPLKGEGEVSPLKMPRKRGLSLSNASPTRSSPRVRKSIFLPRNESAPTLSPPRKSPQVERSPSPKRRCSTASRRSSLKSKTMPPPMRPSVSSSPAKSPRRRLSVSKQALRGAVVHVDVHTTEGEDASGIFVELLQQMGARCVKSWSWNPRASLSPVDGVDPTSSKVGITHVVYKDGGLRTLEKVKHAAGLVKCVGVGWVLDCERENKWLDESPYAVDSSIIPRGGAKRRKSMEPRALSNVNGTLVQVAEPSTPSASGRRCGADWGAVEGFRKITPPTPRGEEPSTPTQQSSSNERFQIPQTPGYNFANLDAIGMSPATPYFLSNRAQLVQQSCPPKQSNRGLFPASKPTLSFEEESDEDTRRQQRARMEAARRKSHFYKPAVQSPLAR